ncbi:MAG: ComEC/Rec2 family competence protein [Treponemataceae bacterium]|nr:ComEC/Rec2 family competence protein [Treponemataceae bacterium]
MVIDEHEQHAHSKWRAARLIPRLQKCSPAVCAALACAGLLYSGLLKPREPPPFSSLIRTKDVCRISGTIASNPIKNHARGTYSAVLSVSGAQSKSGASSEAKGIVSVQIPARIAESYFPGRLYTAAGRSARVFCESGARLSLDGAFSSDGAVFFASSGTQLPWEATLRGRLRHFRALCRLQFRRLLYSWGDAGGLLLALLSGIREYTEDGISDSFRRAGLSHILALSGMHLSLFSGLAASLGKKIGRRASYVLQFLAVCAFVWFAGCSPSLLRAFLCNMLLLAASLCHAVPLKMSDVLAAAFLLHAAIAPQDLHQAAFLLSYCALAGILLFGESASSIAERWLPPSVAASIGTSAGAQALSIPISARLFGVVSPIGIISTAVVSPLIALFLYAGLFWLALCLCVPFFRPPAAFFMNIVYTAIKCTAQLFAAVPCISFRS